MSTRWAGPSAALAGWAAVLELDEEEQAAAASTSTLASAPRPQATAVG